MADGHGLERGAGGMLSYLDRYDSVYLGISSDGLEGLAMTMNILGNVTRILLTCILLWFVYQETGWATTVYLLLIAIHREIKDAKGNFRSEP